jgi:hypothetical protein
MGQWAAAGAITKNTGAGAARGSVADLLRKAVAVARRPKNNGSRPDAGGGEKTTPMNGDWHWFCARPARNYRARLATRAEIDALTPPLAIR